MSNFIIDVSKLISYHSLIWAVYFLNNTLFAGDA